MDFFYKNKSKNDGYQNKCKECIVDFKRNKKLLIKQKAKIAERDFYYIPNIYLVGYGRSQTYQHCCLNCESPFFSFLEFKDCQDLFCDGCNIKQYAIPEVNISNVNFIGHVVGWLAKHESPTKIRTTRNYKRIYQRDNFTCQYCGYNLESATKFLPLHIDHLKPWSAQGGNALDNLCVACQECNLIASDKWFSSFEEKKEFILFERKRKNRE